MSPKKTPPKDLGPEYRVEYPVNVVLTNVMFRCTGCQTWKPGADFGLRCVPNGEGNDIIRNQPRCRSCRHKPTLRRVK